MKEKKKMTVEEVKRKIAKGQGEFQGIIIEDDLDLSEEKIKCNLHFENILIKGDLHLHLKNEKAHDIPV